MRAVRAGLGATVTLRAISSPAKVVASFPQATYVDVDGEVVVLAGCSVPPGPLYLGVEADDVKVEIGSDVTARHGKLTVGGLVVDGYDTAPTWVGVAPDPVALLRNRGAAVAALRVLAEESALHGRFVCRVLPHALEALAERRWTELCRLLLGRGPGLTPAGDDALAGMLVAARALRALDDATAPSWRELAGNTTPHSLGFEQWASLGQAIAPVHDLLTATAAADAAGCAAAVTELACIGASSGADMAFGLKATLEASPAWPVRTGLL